MRRVLITAVDRSRTLLIHMKSRLLAPLFLSVLLPFNGESETDDDIVRLEEFQVDGVPVSESVNPLAIAVTGVMGVLA